MRRAVDRLEAAIRFALVTAFLAAVAPIATGVGRHVEAAGQVVRLLLDRNRMAGWEAGWSIVEPRWTGRRPGR
jgi:hypothetical protein